MGYPLMDLFLLMLYGVLSGRTNLTVKQEPQVLEVAPGDKVNMSCNVNWAEGDRFRVEWKKDGKELLWSTPISRHSQQVIRGSQDKLVWILGNTIVLNLGDVNANDSGHYVCHVTMEIPALKKAEGNGTYLLVSENDTTEDSVSADSFKDSWIKGLPGLFLWLLVTSVMVGSGAVLVKMIWRFLSRSRDSENHFYGNVLSYHQKAKATMPEKGKSAGRAPERKREESIYSTGFPQRPAQRTQSPRALPDPASSQPPPHPHPHLA